MGTLRLLLALAVLLSHAEVRIGYLNPGVTAVIGFYLISGYVMAGLIHRHYGEPARIHRFYLDRVLRLFPQYLVYAALTLAWFAFTGTRTEFLRSPPDWHDIVNNVLVIPLNFYMYTGADAFTLIPPAWSLGAELQFYLVAPLMLLWPRVGVALALLSLGVHAAALHGRLNTDWYGYRLLAGVLWVFAAGMLMFHARRHRPVWAALMACAAPLLALLVYLYLRQLGLHTIAYQQEVLIGWGAGVPLLYWVGKRQTRALDQAAGDLSYGVFLNHFFLIWLLFPAGPRTPLQLGELALCSVVLSWATQRWVEKPVLAWRRRLRQGRVAKSQL